MPAATIFNGETTSKYVSVIISDVDICYFRGVREFISVLARCQPAGTGAQFVHSVQGS